MADLGFKPRSLLPGLELLTTSLAVGFRASRDCRGHLIEIQRSNRTFLQSCPTLGLMSSSLTPDSVLSSLLHVSDILIEFVDNRKLERKIPQLKIQ